MSEKMAIFCSSRKLISYLGKGKVIPQERATGRWKCHGKSCEVCLNFNEISIFTSSVAHDIYRINKKFDCKSLWLIYLLNHKQCPKQYVGQTIADFPFRFQISDINDLFCGMFLYCKIVISLLELFLATCLLCLLQTQFSRRTASIPQKFKKHQHMNFMMVSSRDGKSDIYRFFYRDFFPIISTVYVQIFM